MIAPVTLSTLPLAPSAADAARVVSIVYTLSLIATVPFVVAAVAAFLLRRAPAGTRALVWRSAALAVPVVWLGQLLEVNRLPAVVPAVLAGPLVALGRLQLADAGGVSGAANNAQGMDGVAAAGGVVRLLLLVYAAGLCISAGAMLRGWWSARRVARRGHRLGDAGWEASLAEAGARLALRRRVRLVIADVAVPMTTGIVRPTIILPEGAGEWGLAARRTVLLHESAHILGADVAFAMAARLTCVVLWFHPAAWWGAARLREECELAADDRVLAAGVRASDYAELLVWAADAVGRGRRREATPLALALSRRGGLRRRLSAIVETGRDLRRPARRSVALAAAVAVAVAAPSSAVRVAPTRDVLTTLMRDARWESRAYAVIGLAQRADSVEVARAAAAGDPSPRVRAWAKLALSRTPPSVSAPRPPMPPPAEPNDLRAPRG